MASKKSSTKGKPRGTKSCKRSSRKPIRKSNRFKRSHNTGSRRRCRKTSSRITQRKTSSRRKRHKIRIALLGGKNRKNTSRSKNSSNKIKHLKVLSFNLGANIVKNILGGSEEPMVRKCQRKYGTGFVNKTGLPQCTINAADFILKKDYDVILFQELPTKKRSALNRYINYQKYNVFSNGSVHIFADNSLGKGKVLTNKGEHIIDWYRYVIAVYFSDVNLVIINLHAPHDIDVMKEISKVLQRPYTRLNCKPRNILLGGDFNDGSGSLQSLTVFGHRLTVDKKKKTCCKDSGYRFKGDYIISNNKASSMRIPKNKGLMSDHKPIERTIYLK